MKKKHLYISLLYILPALPITHYGQLPNLGTASDYAVFTSVGAFNSLGETEVTGNVGTNVGAFTGFPIGIVNGQIDVANSNSAQAAIDVENAFDELNGTPCDSIIGISLGNNQILTPNIYCLEEASTLTGDLILDGLNDPDAIFIIKVNGLLSTSMLSNVILINLAQTNNVFWLINGEFILGDSSSFSGTLLVNGAISLLQSSSLIGRALSREGAVSLHNNIIFINEPSNPLPIELLNYTAYPGKIDIQLGWTTASETNNDYYTVQSSNNLISFKDKLIINGAGNSNKLIFYSAIDYSPFDGINYYRLMQTDYDGQYSYSKIIDANLEKSFDISIYPNPFNDFITIRINEISENSITEFSIYNMLGKEYINMKILNQYTIIETSNFAQGMYYYKIVVNSQTIESGKLMSHK